MSTSPNWPMLHPSTSLSGAEATARRVSTVPWVACSQSTRVFWVQVDGELPASWEIGKSFYLVVFWGFSGKRFWLVKVFASSRVLPCVRFLPLFQSLPNKISLEAKINSSKTHTILMESLLQRPWNPHKSMHQNTLRAWLLKENLTFFTNYGYGKTTWVDSVRTLTSHPKKNTSLSQACPPPPRRCMSKFMVVSGWNHQCLWKNFRKKKKLPSIFFNKRFSEISVTPLGQESPKHLPSHLYTPTPTNVKELKPKAAQAADLTLNTHPSLFWRKKLDRTATSIRFPLQAP